MGKAGITFHKSESSYNLSYKLKSVIPTNILYYLSRVFGSKKFKADIEELRGAV
jgi:hypothetical protein